MATLIKNDRAAAYKGIDQDHQAIYESISRLSSMIGADHIDGAAIKGDLDTLILNLSVMFKREENLMALIGYRHALSHSDHHAAAIREILFQMNKPSDGIASTCGNIISFLGNWVINHDKEHDRDLKVFMDQLNY